MNYNRDTTYRHRRITVPSQRRSDLETGDQSVEIAKEANEFGKHSLRINKIGLIVNAILAFIALIVFRYTQVQTDAAIKKIG